MSQPVAGPAVAAAIALACTATATSAPHLAPPATIQRLYPTHAGGREWSLPLDAENASSEWRPDTAVTRVSDGVFYTDGSADPATRGEVRMTVRSPSGKAWWRNVEITAYVCQTGTLSTPGQVSHWELLVRGERHSHADPLFSAVNDGVLAPAGTTTWSWYPLAAGATVNAACLGTSYHGNLYTTGRVHFEKELSHTDGYANARADATHADLSVPGLASTFGRTIGMKLVVRVGVAGAPRAVARSGGVRNLREGGRGG